MGHSVRKLVGHEVEAGVPGEWLEAVLAGEHVPLWQVELVCRDALADPDRGMACVAALAGNARLPDRTRAVACRSLGEAATQTTIAVAATLLRDSDDQWARLAAAEALQRKCDDDAIGALVDALSDALVLSDMWAAFRVPDEAAIALASSADDVAKASIEAWSEGRRATLREGRGTDRALAAYALARLGDAEAVSVLRELAPDDMQAEELLAELTDAR